ncbi:MAG TPA: HAMP domain-containing sensor histidine kinase [Candidatus Dormibacteraeota bacterium]|jgi:signal transduction histidine kinase
MSSRSARHVRRRALRVAALATAMVAAILVALCAGTDILVVRNLTDAADHRLAERIDRLQGPGQPTPDAILGAVPADHDHDYDQPVLTWLISGSRVVAGPGAPPLASGLRAVTAPVTVSIAGTSFRIAGVEAPTGHLVVATTLAPVAQALGGAITGEVLFGALLLLLAFGGALVIGRRVAAPVEEMRQRQLAFTADASHELRTPLGVIEAEVSLALSEAPRIDVYREALEHVAGESERMRRLVDDLLWLARFDDRPPPPGAEPVDVSAVVAGAAERFGAVAASRELQLLVQVPDEVATIDAPPEWIDRLAAVLIDNSCKYSPPGGAVGVTVEGRGARVLLSVTDEGEGIAPAERERIFDRFHRATSTGDGAGLGLAIADSIVQATRGRWEVVPGPGATGTRFTVTWPRAAC